MSRHRGIAMDVRLISPFVSALQNVFRTMMCVEVRVGKPYVKRDDARAAEVNGVIGLSGDATGYVVLSIPKAVACRVASSLAGVEVGVDHPEFADAVGELANMVAGNAKKDLRGLRCGISLPNVVIGQEQVVSQSWTAPRLVVPCKTLLGDFFLEVGLRVEKAAHAPAGAA